ncbi:MAG: archaellin/type IV pilin N-terminal domain-containing protein [Nanoarchaeota archaeon]
MNKKAEMGMGTLIIFIAMVLVAAVAASVLITTTGSLQGKALDTGMSAKEEVGTQIQVLEIFGTDSADSDGDLDTLNVTVKLAPGSESVKIDDLLILVDGNAVTPDNTTLYDGGDIGDSLDANEVGTIHLSNSDLGASTSVDIQLIPKVGTPTIVNARTPSQIDADSTVQVFP